MSPLAEALCDAAEFGVELKLDFGSSECPARLTDDSGWVLAFSRRSDDLFLAKSIWMQLGRRGMQRKGGAAL